MDKNTLKGIIFTLIASFFVKPGEPEILDDRENIPTGMGSRGPAVSPCEVDPWGSAMLALLGTAKPLEI